MATDKDFVAYLLELFAPAGRASSRRMFGGTGIYVDGLFCAIEWDGRLFLKVDDATRADFAGAGCAPFVYEGPDGPLEMSYWSVPESALDSAEDMAPWLQRAMGAAGRKAAKKKPAKKTPAKKKPAQKKPARP
jgi:DNA transformation protein